MSYPDSGAIWQVKGTQHIPNFLSSPLHSHHPGLRPAAKFIYTWMAWATKPFNTPAETYCSFYSTFLERPNTPRLSRLHAHGWAPTVTIPAIFCIIPKQSSTQKTLLPQHVPRKIHLTPFLPDSTRKIIVRFACSFV